MCVCSGSYNLICGWTGLISAMQRTERKSAYNMSRSHDACVLIVCMFQKKMCVVIKDSSCTHFQSHFFLSPLSLVSEWKLEYIILQWMWSLSVSSDKIHTRKLRHWRTLMPMDYFLNLNSKKNTARFYFILIRYSDINSSRKTQLRIQLVKRRTFKL